MTFPFAMVFRENHFVQASTDCVPLSNSFGVVPLFEIARVDDPLLIRRRRFLFRG